MSTLIRQSASYALVLLIAAAASHAGFSGFPLSTSHNTWTEAQQAVQPLEQLWAAIDERCAALAIAPLGSVVETNTVDVGWAATNSYLGGGWHMVWDGPDELGRYEIYLDGEFLWVIPQQYDPEGWGSVFIDGYALTNYYQVTTNVVTTNQMGAFSYHSVTGFTYVTREVLDLFWEKLDELAPKFVYLGTNTPESWFAQEKTRYEYLGGAAWMASAELPPPLQTAPVLGDAGVGFEWVRLWRSHLFNLYSEFPWAEIVQSNALDTLLAEARTELSGTVVYSRDSPAIIPEYYLVGPGTNSPAMPRMAYYGTNDPAAFTTTLTGYVWTATYITNTSSFDYFGTPVPTGIVYSGASALPATEDVAATGSSTNIWQSVYIASVAGMTNWADTIALKWEIPAISSYRLYAQELDKMYAILVAMKFAELPLFDAPQVPNYWGYASEYATFRERTQESAYTFWGPYSEAFITSGSNPEPPPGTTNTYADAVSIVRATNNAAWSASPGDKTNRPTAFMPVAQYGTGAAITYEQYADYANTTSYWQGVYSEEKVAARVDVTLSNIPTGTPFTVSVFLGGYTLATTNETGEMVLYEVDNWTDNAFVPTPGRMYQQYSADSSTAEHNFFVGNIDQPESLSLVPAGPEDQQTTNQWWQGNNWYGIREFDFQYK
jgi:hypothetical protein